MNPLPIAATFSKDPCFWGVDFQPQRIVHGDGAYVLGDDGHIYVDWVSALGANILGYNNREFVLRVQRQVGLGVGFSLPHTLEEQVAEKMVNMVGNHVPGWTPESLGMRFGLSGTDATTMAVRLARAVTGWQRVLSFGYHGWADWSVAKTPPHWGISEQDITDIPFNDLEVIERHLDSHFVAAVILEQPMVDPEPGYYNGLRKLCDEHGALLILDEVVTGLRFGLGGAAEVYGVKPDIVCYGKSLGNGVPTSCMVGHKEYFEWFRRNDPVFVSSTHFGNALSLAAADAVLDLWNADCVDHLWAVGEALMFGLKDVGYTVIGHGPRSLLQFDTDEERAYFIVEMRDRGILANRPWIPNLAHTEDDVLRTIKASKEVKQQMAMVDVAALMKDRLPRVLFRGR